MRPLRTFLLAGAAVLALRALVLGRGPPSGPPGGWLQLLLQHPWRASAALGCAVLALAPRVGPPDQDPEHKS